MTNSQTIEKLNEALNKLIDAYEILQDKNTSLKNEIEQKSDNINDLENKLNELNGSTEVQSTKMDGMLNKIQSLLGTDEPIQTENTNKNENTNISGKLFDDDIDLKISEDTTEEKPDEETTSFNNKVQENNNNIDLGRMESLLNGLNK